MNTLTFIVIAILALALGYFIVLLLIRIRNNVISGQSYRKALQAEIAALRMDGMMAALGINRQRYLHQQSTLDIHQHMQRCRECGNTDTCDHQIATKTIDKNTIDYCNNAESLRNVIDQQNETSDQEPISISRRQK